MSRHRGHPDTKFRQYVRIHDTINHGRTRERPPKEVTDHSMLMHLLISASDTSGHQS